MTDMVHRPASTSNELQYGLHHVADHNARWEENGANLRANSSEHLTPHSGDPYINDPYSDMHYPGFRGTGESGLGLEYSDVGSGYAGGNHADGHQYSGSHHFLRPGAHHSPSLKPSMTPASTEASDSGIVTRRSSSRAASRSPGTLKGESNNTRVSKPARQRKPKANKTLNSKTPKLDKPLSELTKDMKDVPVRDMDAWVNRTDEVRQKEAEKRNGYITRPMNSFMLYRSAYADRTKQWCLQNNHQVVSAVSGESWPLEPTEVRDHYNELAKTERDNHARAHPTYKFSPSKPPPQSNIASRKKKTSEYSSEEENNSGWISDAGESDGEWLPSGHRGAGAGRSRRQGREAGFPVNMAQNPGFLEDQRYSFQMGAGGDGLFWNPMMGNERSSSTGFMPNDWYNQPFQTFQQAQQPAMLGAPLNAQYPQAYPNMMVPSVPLGMPGGASIPQMDQTPQFFHSNSQTPLPATTLQSIEQGSRTQVDPSLLQFGEGQMDAKREGSEAPYDNPLGAFSGFDEHFGEAHDGQSHEASETSQFDAWMESN